MKYVKILGLLAVAAAALMAFAGTASATVITSPTGTVLPEDSVIHAESEESAVVGTNQVLLHNSIAEIKCDSTASFTNDHTNAAGTTTGPITSLSFTNCNSPWTVTVNTLGSLEVHSSGSYNGTLTSKGTKVTATNDSLGVNCVYETNAATGTDVGTITGGNPATLDIIASIPRIGGSFLCGGSAANWTGAYKSTGQYYIHS